MKTDVSKFKDETLENIYNTSIKEDSEKKEIGLTEEIIRNISKEKNEPEWVLDIRLKALDLFYKLPMPTWGPDISYLDLSKIANLGFNINICNISFFFFSPPEKPTFNSLFK